MMARCSCGSRFDTLRFIPVGGTSPESFGSRFDTELYLCFLELVFLLSCSLVCRLLLLLFVFDVVEIVVRWHHFPHPIQRRGGPKARAKAAVH